MVLPAREAYRRWAPLYDRETVVSALEERVVRALGWPPPGRHLLAAGCGTGRRLPDRTAFQGRAVGVDLVPEMLAARPRPDRRRPVVAGDVRSLPFRTGLFDRLWCRLVLGHLSEPGGAYRELARVAAGDARLLVSDFHPAAVAAGHTRTFRDERGRLRTVEHHVHSPDDHHRAAVAAGWTPEGSEAAPAGSPERSFYERAGRLEQFERERDLPLVLVMWFRR